ncbi:MAG: hypothetical protein VKK04_04895 [Synechococcales bacterium]|nr:hypothetical protein [Synechococcales bacterium]
MGATPKLIISRDGVGSKEDGQDFPMGAIASFAKRPAPQSAPWFCGNLSDRSCVYNSTNLFSHLPTWLAIQPIPLSQVQPQMLDF